MNVHAHSLPRPMPIFSDDPNTMSREQLIARVDNLEAEVEALRESMGPIDTLQMQRTFGLTPHEAKLVRLLADGRPRQKMQILSALYADMIDDPPEIKIIDVFVCKIRKKLNPYGIEIETIWGSGYALHDAHGNLKAALAGQPVEEIDIAKAIFHPKHLTKKKHGEDRLVVYSYLLSIADAKGEARGVACFTSRELAAATKITRCASDMTNWLQARGEIVILHRPKPGGNGDVQWRVRVKAANEPRCPKCGALPDERFDCCSAEVSP